MVVACNPLLVAGEGGGKNLVAGHSTYLLERLSRASRRSGKHVFGLGMLD